MARPGTEPVTRRPVGQQLRLLDDGLGERRGRDKERNGEEPDRPSHHNCGHAAVAITHLRALRTTAVLRPILRVRRRRGVLMKR